MSAYSDLSRQDHDIIATAAGIVAHEIWHRTAGLEYTGLDTMEGRQLCETIHEMYQACVNLLRHGDAFHIVDFEAAVEAVPRDTLVDGCIAYRELRVIFNNTLLKARCANVCTALGAETASHLMSIEAEFSQSETVPETRSRTLDAELLWSSAIGRAMGSIYSSLPLF